MSRHNERPYNYEVVDLDASIVSLGDNTATHVAAEDGQPPPTLPTGAVVDGKNTLQSFELPGDLRLSLESPLEKELEMPAHPLLPDGQVITGKNTLQSFDALRGNSLQQTPLDPPDHVTEDDNAKRLSNEEAPPPNAIVTSPPPPETVVAVAVESDTGIVYAEVSPEPVESSVAPDHHANENALVAPPWYQARSTYVFLTVIALLLAVVLGVSIGLSNDSSNSAAPASAPISDVRTSAPTSAPIAIDPNITIREAVLTSYINTIAFSTQTITVNGTSPESQALAWMIYNDTTLETSALISEDSSFPNNAIGFRIRQRYPLLVMWFQQNETVKWAVTTGWLVDQAECAWEGISCKALPVSYFDDDYLNLKERLENVVTELRFNLVGSYVGVIPSDIGLLSDLEHFEIKSTRDPTNFNGRYLQGALPASIGEWTALTYFDGNGNGLTGSLPDSIGQWTALRSFNVSDNDLTGTLPDSIGQWTALTYFDGNGNGLTGSLPDSIGQWTVLTSFDVSGNGLTGSLPDSIGQWTALSSFAISDNDLTGTLPNSIGQWTALTTFDGSSNGGLTGILPSSIEQWTALTFFDVSVNTLNGTLPTSIVQWTALTHCDISFNFRLAGTLPDSIGQWTAITFFSAAVNALTGTLPDSIGQWTALTTFDVYSNAFNGTIPSSIGNWSLIEYAVFSGNPFVGILPNAICQYIDPDMDTLWGNCRVNCTCCTIGCG